MNKVPHFLDLWNRNSIKQQVEQPTTVSILSSNIQQQQFRQLSDGDNVGQIKTIVNIVELQVVHVDLINN